MSASDKAKQIKLGTKEAMVNLKHMMCAEQGNKIKVGVIVAIGAAIVIAWTILCYSVLD